MGGEQEEEGRIGTGNLDFLNLFSTFLNGLQKPQTSY